jgi:single-strand DNA-binding protein
MKWQNKVQLIGYLGTDPQVKILPSGFYCAKLRLATNSGFSNENKKRITTWHNIKVWGKRPAYIQNCLMKGSHVLVDGIITHRNYTDKDGQQHKLIEIKATKVMNLDR